MSISSFQAAEHFEQRVQQVSELMAPFEALRLELARHHTRVASQAAAAQVELAQAYLPALSAEALQRAEKLTGFRGFTRRDPLAAMAKQADMLRRTVARVLADENYQRREYIVGPAGSLTLERVEVLSLLEPWVHECQRFEGLEGFQELVELGYDTPDYEIPVLSVRYWKLWAAGDGICEALELDDFGDDVLPAYRKVAAERIRWQGELARVDARIDAVHELVREHDHAVATLPQLPAMVLTASQQALADFFENADPALLAQWLTEDQDSDRSLTMGLRKAAGLQAKLGYLIELRTQAVDGVLADLTGRQSKYQRKAAKFRRKGVRPVSAVDVERDRRFDEKIPKFHSRHAKLSKLTRRLVAYDGYQRFELDNDPDLWWFEFTGSRPSRLTPRLRSWYDEHPEHRPDHDPSLAEAAAVAAVTEATAAQAGADDLGYIS